MLSEIYFIFLLNFQIFFSTLSSPPCLHKACFSSVLQINPNSKAWNQGVKVGDVLVEINQQKTHGLNYADAQLLIKNSTSRLQLAIAR
jgi:hypothetical protein